MLKKTFLLSLAAGIFISIGGAAFLSCDDRAVGAVLFSVGLLSICTLGLYLFTGKIGYLAEERTAAYALSMVITLVGNLTGTLLGGRMIGWALPKLAEKAATLCAAKLALSPAATVITAFFCGILMYTAVAIYKEKGTLLGVFFCVPAFILSGFEHSIADLFYFFAAWSAPAGQTAAFLALVVLGNTLGGLFLPALRLCAGERR